MMCGLSELGLDERDFPYAVIEAAALLNDYKPTDPEKPSIPADIHPGHKIYDPVLAAQVLECTPQSDGSFHTCRLKPFCRCYPAFYLFHLLPLFLYCYVFISLFR